jgi:hypothetical protein
MRSYPTPRATTYARLAVKVVLAVRWRHAQPISRSDTAESCPIQRSWVLLSLTGHFTGRISRDTFAQRSSLGCGGVARWGVRTTRALPTPVTASGSWSVEVVDTSGRYRVVRRVAVALWVAACAV